MQISLSPMRAIQTLLFAALLALGGASAFANDSYVNINTADAQTLADALVGVGLSRAEAIVAYRQANGEFRDAYELTAVKGIGDRTVERNEANIRLRD